MLIYPENWSVQADWHLPSVFAKRASPPLDERINDQQAFDARDFLDIESKNVPPYISDRFWTEEYGVFVHPKIRHYMYSLAYYLRVKQSTRARQSKFHGEMMLRYGQPNMLRGFSKFADVLDRAGFISRVTERKIFSETIVFLTSMQKHRFMTATGALPGPRDQGRFKGHILQQGSEWD